MYPFFSKSTEHLSSIDHICIHGIGLAEANSGSQMQMTLCLFNYIPPHELPFQATTVDVLSWKFPPAPPFNVGDTKAINGHEFLPQHCTGGKRQFFPTKVVVPVQYRGYEYGLFCVLV